MVIIMLTSGLALLLACAAFAVYEIYAFHHSLVANLSTLADVLANNAATGLDVDAPASVREDLQALRADPNLVGAAVYDKNNAVFAVYDRKSDRKVFIPPSVGEAGWEFKNNVLRLFRPVDLKGRRIGMLYLEAEPTVLYARLRRYSLISGAVLLSSFLAAFVLSSWLQRFVSGPILQLLDTMRVIAEEKNYAMRATRPGNDELGALVDSFNHMLSQLQTRDAELQAGKNFLEQRVAERTSELASANASLQQENAERKHAEEKVRRMEDLYRRAIRGADAVPYAYDYATRTYIFMDDGIERLTGYKPSEMGPQLWKQIVQESIMGGETSGLPKEEAADRVRRGELRTWRCDMRFITRDGRMRWVSDASVQNLDDEGRPTGSIGILQDITERKQLEHDLQKRGKITALAAEIGVLLARQDTLSSTLQQCAQTVVKYLDAAFVRVWILNPRENMLELQASAGLYTHLDGRHSRIPMGNLKVGRIAQERKPQFTNSVADDPLISDHEWAKREGMVGFAGLPLKIGEQILGVIGLFSRRALAEDCIEGLESVADALALGVVRKQMEEEREKFFALVENSSDFIAMSTLEGAPFYINRAGKKLIGIENHYNLGEQKLHEYCDTETWTFLSNVVFPAVFKNGFWEGECHLQNLKTGAAIDVHRHSFLLKNPHTGESLCIATIQRDITERKKAEESLRLLSSAIEQSADNVVITDRKGEIKYANPAFLALTGYSAEELAGQTPRLLKSGQHSAAYYKILWDRLLAGKAFRGEFINRKKNGDLFTEEKTITPVTDTDGSIKYFVASGRDITERKKTEAEVAALNQQLVIASRQAGMSEVATNVLHNVGNVLNSVNVSTSVLIDKIKGSRVSSLTRVAGLLRENSADLGSFITSNDQGRQVPGFLLTLADHLVSEQEAALHELASLNQNVEHIKDIVSMQQSYARVSGVVESLSVVDLVEDAIRMNSGALAGHDVHLLREYSEIPPINTERHKVLQILINLLRNAKYALDEGQNPDKLLRVRVEDGDGRHIKVSVSDSGVGIPRENLTRIFNHGFTTRKNGHGFGLHGGALAAKELGGSLSAYSDGPGLGATFTLILPYKEKLTDS
ncbi:MAG TPA: PAS domain S-box protein [Candidatus Dormibacteraeota bacterium]|nr:PAS domain S-box protein [Candidatus Dormibacteraeota bacterium]